jgi:hypothetical protein
VLAAGWLALYAPFLQGERRVAPLSALLASMWRWLGLYPSSSSLPPPPQPPPGVAWGLAALRAGLALAAAGSYLVASLIDPSDPALRRGKGGDGQEEEERKGDEEDGNKSAASSSAPSRVFCSACGVHVLASAKHCRECNRCVAAFDHHCRWSNNCVGAARGRGLARLASADGSAPAAVASATAAATGHAAASYNAFAVLVASMFASTLMDAGTGLYVLVQAGSMMRSGGVLIPRLPLPLLLSAGYGGGGGGGGMAGAAVFQALTAAHTALAWLALLPLLELAAFHVMLAGRRQTTYEFIMEQRRREEQKEEAPLPPSSPAASQPPSPRPSPRRPPPSPCVSPPPAEASASPDMLGSSRIGAMRTRRGTVRANAAAVAAAAEAPSASPLPSPGGNGGRAASAATAAAAFLSRRPFAPPIAVGVATEQRQHHHGLSCSASGGGLLLGSVGGVAAGVSAASTPRGPAADVRRLQAASPLSRAAPARSSHPGGRRSARVVPGVRQGEEEEEQDEERGVGVVVGGAGAG